MRHRVRAIHRTPVRSQVSTAGTNHRQQQRQSVQRHGHGRCACSESGLGVLQVTGASRKFPSSRNRSFSVLLGDECGGSRAYHPPTQGAGPPVDRLELWLLLGSPEDLGGDRPIVSCGEKKEGVPPAPDGRSLGAFPLNSNLK